MKKGYQDGTEGNEYIFLDNQSQEEAQILGIEHDSDGTLAVFSNGKRQVPSDFEIYFSSTHCCLKMRKRRKKRS